MKEYPIEVVIWVNDPSGITENLENLEENPSLAVGIITEESEDSISIVSSIRPRRNKDKIKLLEISKSSIIGRKHYGKIRLRDVGE